MIINNELSTAATPVDTHNPSTSADGDNRSGQSTLKLMLSKREVPRKVAISATHEEAGVEFTGAPKHKPISAN